ncbi:DMT family transporter [Desulfotomaculum defluvii]
MPAIFKIITAMIIWGSLGVFVRHIQLPSLEIAFYRALIASIILLLVFLTFKNKNLQSIRRNLLVLVISGVAIGLNWVMLFQAYRYTTISNATLTYYLAPVLIVLISPFVLREKISFTKIISVLGGMAGLVLIISQQSNNTTMIYNHSVGISYGLIAAVLYAGIVLLNKRMKKIDGFQMTLVQLATSALVMLPMVVARTNFRIVPDDLTYVLILGLVHTGLAYWLYFSGLKEMKAQNVALFSYLDPISAVLFGTLLLNEPMGLWQAIGGFLILGSAVFGSRENMTQGDGSDSRGRFC